MRARTCISPKLVMPATSWKYAPIAQRRGLRRESRQAEPNAHARVPAVGGDHHRTAFTSQPASILPLTARPGNRWSLPAVSTTASCTSTPSSIGRLHPRPATNQRHVEIATPDRPPHTPSVAPFDAHAVCRRSRSSRQAASRSTSGRRRRAQDARASPATPGFSVSPHSLCRGNRARSSTSTRAPARASTVAAIAPAGPAPAITTSMDISHSDRESLIAESPITKSTAPDPPPDPTWKPRTGPQP